MRARSVYLSLFLLLSGAVRAQEKPDMKPGVRLEELLSEAGRVHPAIQAAARMAEAKRARMAQARALPDPQLSVGYMGDPAPFKTQRNDPASYRQFGVMQEFPWPGKRDLRAQIAGKDADAELWNVEAARRQVLGEVRAAYYEMWGVERALSATEKNKELLEKLARIAEEKYKVGKGLQQDVWRAQLEVTRVQQRLAVLGQRRRTLEAQLNSLLLRPAESAIGPLEEVKKAELVYSLNELIERGVANAPEMRRQHERIEQSRLAVNLAQKEFLPDFGVGWDYQNRVSGQREMFGLRFTVNIPIFNKGKRRAAVDEATLEQAAARQTREALRTALMFRVKEQYLAARTSEELLSLYAKGLVPQATLALESALAAYQTGTLDFLSVLANFSSVLEYEAAYYQELAGYQKALARLEEITGIPLTGAEGATPERKEKP